MLWNEPILIDDSRKAEKLDRAAIDVIKMQKKAACNLIWQESEVLPQAPLTGSTVQEQLANLTIDDLLSASHTLKRIISPIPAVWIQRAQGDISINTFSDVSFNISTSRRVSNLVLYAACVSIRRLVTRCIATLNGAVVSEEEYLSFPMAQGLYLGWVLMTENPTEKKVFIWYYRRNTLTHSW